LFPESHPSRWLSFFLLMTNTSSFPVFFVVNSLLMKRLLFCFLLLAPAFRGASQNIDKNQLAEKVGLFMKKVGPMEGSSVTNIIDSIKTGHFNEVETTYAIYYWITHYIGFDSKAFHHRRQANTTASAALSTRAALSESYAALFKAMCDVARIECVIIDGYAKAHAEFIGNISDDNKHSWNAVKIRNTWYYIDVTWGAGTVSKKFRDFEKNYTDAWFFTKRQLFLLTHYPDNKKWQLTDAPINRSAFANAPSVYVAAIVLQVFPSDDLRGRIRGKENDCKRIVLQMEVPENIKQAEVVAAGKRLPADLYKQGKTLSIDLPLPEDGKYPLLLYLNGTPAYGFMAEVSKKKGS